MLNDANLTAAGSPRDYSRLHGTAFEIGRMRRLSVVVVGAGALGNEVVKNLALMGVGRLSIVDRDVIEPSNLTRSILFCGAAVEDHIRDRTPKAVLAAARATEVNPDVAATAYTVEVADLPLPVLRQASLVFSCVDNEMARVEVSWTCTRLDVPLIDGGLGLNNHSSGEVSSFPGAEGPCYSCRKTVARRRELLQQMHGREDSCAVKEARARVDGVVVTTPIMASTIGAMQVELGLRALSEPARDRAAGKSWRLTLHPVPSLDSALFGRSAGCPLHDPDSVVREVMTMAQPSARCTPNLLLDAAGIRAGFLRLDWPMVATAACGSCSHAWRPWLRRARFHSEACPACGSHDLVEHEVVSAVSRDSVHADVPLTELGQPLGHIYELVDTDRARCTSHVELTGDRPAAMSVLRDGPQC